MPPHLHPRSRSTSILFTGTLLAGFVVVGMPHIYPCPAPRKRLADSPEKIIIGPDGQPMRLQRQRRRRKDMEDENGEQQILAASLQKQSSSEHSSQGLTSGGLDLNKRLEAQKEMLLQAQDEAAELENEARQCPVPKPTGVLGSLLGFQKETGRIDADIREQQR